MRECGTCTKCCEGWLTGEINFRSMYPGKPCYLVEIGKGCKDYDNRPLFPCKLFTCAWILDEEIPEEYKPEISGVIVKYIVRDGQKNIALVEAPNYASDEMIDFFKSLCDKHGYGLGWRDSTDTPFFYNTTH